MNNILDILTDGRCALGINGVSKHLNTVAGTGLLLFIILLSGCTVSIGIGVHPRNSDEPEFNSPNPIGIVEGTTKITDKIDGFCMHASSLPQYEYGYGLNLCGVKYKLK